MLTAFGRQRRGGGAVTGKSDFRGPVPVERIQLGLRERKTHLHVDVPQSEDEDVSPLVLPVLIVCERVASVVVVLVQLPCLEGVSVSP